MLFILQQLRPHQGVICFDSEKKIHSLYTYQYIQLSSTWSSQSKLLKHWYEVQTWTCPERHRHPDIHTYSHCFIKTECSFGDTSRNIVPKRVSNLLTRESVIWNLKIRNSSCFLALKCLIIHITVSLSSRNEHGSNICKVKRKNIKLLQHFTCYILCFRRFLQSSWRYLLKKRSLPYQRTGEHNKKINNTGIK